MNRLHCVRRVPGVRGGAGTALPPIPVRRAQGQLLLNYCAQGKIDITMKPLPRHCLTDFFGANGCHDPVSRAWFVRQARAGAAPPRVQRTSARSVGEVQAALRWHRETLQIS